jgi:heme o synthase
VTILSAIPHPLHVSNSPVPVSLSPSALATEHSSAAATARALFVLTKPRLAFFSVLTAMAAYSSAVAHTDWAHLGLTTLAVSLSAAGALSLNQWWERQTDAVMRRTRARPLPARQLSPTMALTWSLSLGVVGVVTLLVISDVVAAGLSAATILIYGVVYTPMKRKSRWATEVGAISGALPPLLGAAAAGDVWAPAGWILFVVILFWQMPHFFAIGWKYRDDYRAAGFPLLPAIDATGARTAAWSFGYTMTLVAVSLIPFFWGYAGGLYALGAAVAGLLILIPARQFLVKESGRDVAAKKLFIASVIYLPIVLVSLMLDQLSRG